jgi:glucose-1-phosphate cytidylyltransferase
MKCIILAGGYGSRLSEETIKIPKPMVAVGGYPILWHILKIYSYWGINDFVICLGYKGYAIKEYFANYHLHMNDVTIDIVKNNLEIINNATEPWRITLIDTGQDTMTAGRIRRVIHQVKDEEAFCLTYGDGVSDVNITNLINFHKAHRCLATVTSVPPPQRFGRLLVDQNKVLRFEEKPDDTDDWINGGFFILSPKVDKYLGNDDLIWEHEPLQRLATDGQLNAFKHLGFWHPMDTMRDKYYLEELWLSGKAPWKQWD